MTETRSPEEQGRNGHAPDTAPAAPRRRRRRALRIALISLASTSLLLGAAAAGTFVYVNHEVGSIPRVNVKFLAKQDAASGMTMLLTDTQVGPTGFSDSAPPFAQTGLIMLLHFNADRSSGGVVSLPPQAEVSVPGYGRTMPLWDVIALGGPSLLTETVHNLTGVPINHYARIDFNHVASMVDALDGVSVTLPEATESFGQVFQAGVNHVDGVQAMEYARQPSLTETGRVLRQESLMRAVLSKMSDAHLLVNPLTMTRVLNALTSMLAVDSSFTNSQILSMATELGDLSSSKTTFVSAPTQTVDGTVTLNPAESSALWSAINGGSIASFAQQYPATVTPAAP
jgi:LCP family protein required for cell wall assembly